MNLPISRKSNFLKWQKHPISSFSTAKLIMFLFQKARHHLNEIFSRYLNELCIDLICTLFRLLAHKH